MRSACSWRRPDGGEPVVLRALLVLGDLPLRVDQAPTLEAVESRIERAVIHVQHVERGGADGDADAVAVLHFPLQRAEDQQVEGALEQVFARPGGGLGHR